MAKKLVKYAFGNQERYDAILKKDQYTVYFVYDTVIDPVSGKEVPGEYGTIYKGNTRIGSSKASDIVFDREMRVVLLQGESEEDSMIYTIEAGTSLADFAAAVLKKVAAWDEELYSKFVGNGTPENPGIICSIIEEQSAFDAEGNGLGIISDAINTRISEGIGENGVITAFLNENFVSRDLLGEIQRLAGILTPETIDVLVKAASDIQNVLADYYTKEEADEKLKDVLFFNNYDSFPETGDSSILYVDCDENILYRWGKEDDSEVEDYYVSVGGSGAGSGDVKTETKIYVKGGKTTLSIAKGNALTLEFIFSSAYTQMKYNKRTGSFEKIMQETGTTGSVRYYLDGVQFDSGTVRQSSYIEGEETSASVNVYNRVTVAASRLNSSSHELKIVCADGEGNSATEQVFINIISASINSSYVPTPTNLTNNIRIPVTIISTTDAELFYKVDDEETVKVQDVIAGSPVITISISPEGPDGNVREHGYHTIKVWATTYIEESDTTISTSVLSYDVIWYELGNVLPIITTSYNVPVNDEGKYDIVQYEYATLKYQVYSDGEPTTVVDLVIKDLDTNTERIVNTLEVDTVTKSWTYTFDEVGTYELYVKAHYTENSEDKVLISDKYDVIVAKSSISMDATAGSVLYFTAKNRSNDEQNPASWTDEIGGVQADLQGFLWNSNSGWYTNNETATTSLKVAGGARCTIPYQPFAIDKRGTGQVLEIDFSTSNLSDATAEVIRCYSETDKSGIQITATGAYFSSNEFGYTTDGDARIHVPFKENERIRIAFVITPWEMDENGNGPEDAEAKVNLWNGTRYEEQNSVTNGWWRFVKIYINGICVGINSYSSSFKQSVPSNIVIGSDKATVDIYSIRAYDTVLYDRAIVNNFIADTQNPVEKLRLFKRNNILNVAGTDVEPSSLRRLMPCLFITCQTDATVSGITNNEHILPTNKADKRGVTIYFDCDGLDDEAREYYNFCHTFVAFNVQFAVQGTSSQYYPRRNWKATFKTEKKFKDDYTATATGSKPTYVFYDVPWEEDIKNGRDARGVYANKYKDKYSNKYILKDFSESFTGIRDEDRTVDEITSIAAKKFCLKADFAESSGTHNTGLAKYVDFILKSLGYDYLTPPQKAQYLKTRNMVDVTFRTSVDGYPIAMFWRPTFNDSWEFYGKFNFNIDKGAESSFGFIDLGDGGISSSDVNPMTGQPFVEFNEDYYDAAPQEDRLLYEPPIECWEFTNNSTDLCKFRNITPTSFTEKSKDADGVTELPSWLGSFETRHPDNDTLIDLDYGTGLKKPTHWAAFSEWVSSTDRQGCHNFNKDLPIPTTWNGTFAELTAGAADKEIFAVYEGKLTEFIAATEAEMAAYDADGTPMTIDINRRYILQPVAIDPGDGTISPDQSYDLYGHIVHYNIPQNSKWYVDELDHNTWVDDGEYIEEESAVDYTKAYYIANQAEENFGYVYSYNSGASAWQRIASINDYALDAPVTYSMVTYQYDTAEYRFAKFRNELPLHMNIPVTTAYYVMTEFFGCADQRAKNMMFASWGYEPGASKVKPANAYSSEEAANAAGYKGVYSYELGTISSAKTPTKFAAASPETRGIVLGAGEKTVVINEIHPDGKKMEFYNTTNAAISLKGYTLKGIDETGDARADWSFPADASIAAHGYYVITFKSTDTVNGPSYGLSGKKAWTFWLHDNNGTELDTVTNNLYTDGTTGFAGSYGRETDGADTWAEFATPTIGSANVGGSVIPEEPEIPVTTLSSYLPYTTEATELSGLCFNADKSGLFGVSDTGKVYSIAFDGTTTDLNIAELVDEDLEGITIDASGNLYAINESTGKVWMIAAPAYNTAVEAFTVTPVGENPNSNGFEGITVFGNNFIVGNQRNPISLYTVTNAGGTPTLLATLDCVTEIADVEYDGTNIWVLDSNEATLVKLSAAGELITKYSLPFITTADNGPEALAIDGNVAYIGCDNTNMDLFKVSLNNNPFGKTIVINECDPDAKRWELYNVTNDDIDMTGYSMTKTDSAGEDVARRFVFGQVNATKVIPAHGFMVLQQNTNGVDGPNFGMSGTKGFDYKIYDASGNIIEHLDNLTTIQQITDGQTYGRISDGADEFVLFKNHGSIGSSNSNGILNSSELYINEIDTNGNSVGKRFEIYNAGASPVDLTGYTFTKDDSSWTLTPERIATAVGEGKGVSSLIIPAEGRVVIQTNNTKSNKATAESPAKDANIWPDFGISGSKGFVLGIKDANGNLLDKVNYLNENVVNATFIPLNEGETIGRYPDGGSEFHIFNSPTIGEANVAGTSISGILSSMAVDTELSTVVINEISPSTDTIELYNTTNEAISLAGFGIIKNFDFNTYWSIPFSATSPAPIIPAHGFYVINFKQWNAAVGPTFGISAKDGFALTLTQIIPGTFDTNASTGDITFTPKATPTPAEYVIGTKSLLVIHDVVNNLSSSENFISLSGEYSMGRTPDGSSEWKIYEVSSIGETNANGVVYEPAIIDPGTLITDHLVINEINGTSKMIEIYNPTSSAVNLESYGLLKVDLDEYSATDWYTFPAGASIPANGYFTLCADKVKTGADAAYHTEFGISLNPGKVFQLYLVSFTNSLDTTSKETILSTGTVVDDVDNLTNPVNYETKDEGLSYGRVNDGSENWTLFNVDSMSATTGPSSDTRLSNANGQAKAQAHTETGTIKTVLYWVPIDSEYIWYPIFYDNDTILSLDNTGHIKFNPNVESTDRVGTGYAYNGTESVLWINFKDAYDAEIRSTYVNMRSKGGLTYANCMKYFNTSQSAQWPENVYNIDGKFKYIIPATKGYVDYSTQDETGKYGVTIRNSTYLYECQGSREEHRKWWLNNRFTYMDSRYFAVAYAEDYATIRLYTPAIWSGVTPSSTFKLTPYADMYLRVMFGQIVSTLRAEKNKTYDIIPSDPNLRFNDTETIIYGASNILSFGDMTNKYAGSVAIDKASKITDIVLGADEPYYNENITKAGLTIGAGNTTLKNIDLRGCTKLNSISGLNQITSIEKVDARRTGITSFDFSTQGANLREIRYPNAITDIKLVNMKNISYNNIYIPTYENLKTLWIENCPQLKTDSWNIVNNILSDENNMLSVVRLGGFVWNINTNVAYDTWKKLLKLGGFDGSGIQSLTIPYLSGTVNIGGEVIVSTGYKAGIEEMFKDAGGLKVNVTNQVSMTGIEIVPEAEILDNRGDAVITPNKSFKFNASYLPDDFVLSSEKGVTWDVDPALTVSEQTSEYIILSYIGSTDGNKTYYLTATSIHDNQKSGTLVIRPSATLSKIRIKDTTQKEVVDAVYLNEGSRAIFYVDFLPEGTEDTSINISTVNGSYIDWTYEPDTKTLTVVGKDVDRVRECSILLQSATVAGKSASLHIFVNNVVSRIFKIKNAEGDGIKGYVEVSYTDRFTGQPTESVFRSGDDGVISIRTDSSCGFGELKVKAHANDEGRFFYNEIETFTSPELSTTTSSDVEYTFTFFEPITARITINNAGAPVVDRNLRIDSFQNENTRGLIVPPYNRVVGGKINNGEPATVKLLANTSHTITITELDDSGNIVTSGGRYSQFTGTIKTTTSDTDYTITISRDYLGTVNDDNELHMTVLTGTQASAGNIVRLYVRTAGEITIDWGDEADNNSAGHTTTIDGTTYGFNQDLVIYHRYLVFEKEYDITVSTNTARIRWFHVIPENATEMKPCIGTTSSQDGFHANFDQTDTGGLVAYQSIGAAQFSTMPTFRFSNKNYSKLLCVGNVFKSCTEATSAEGLLENTTVEQIANVPLFEKCVNITSFRSTFKNSNINTLPSNFFASNTKATDFTETFAGCIYLSSINADANTEFIKSDEGVEVTSLVRMFSGCTTLTGEVPALWRMFYGCSFVLRTPQYTFENCTARNITNFDDIPGTWGGNINVTYVESTYKELSYINCQNADTAEFVTNIYPRGNYRYEYDLMFINNNYEMMPLFGAAVGTTDGTNYTLDTVTDYCRGGEIDGSQPNGYTGRLPYRIGKSSTSAWSGAVTPSTEEIAAVFGSIGGGDEYGKSGNRIVMDISYTTDGKVTVYPYGTVKENTMQQYLLKDWANGAEWEATLPLKIMNIYNDREVEYDTNDGNKRTDFVRGKNVIFYSLKIYDDTPAKTLIHEIIPVYGQIPNTTTVAPMLWDKITDSVFVCSTSSVTNILYYAKKKNED